MCATEEPASSFNTVSNHSAGTVVTRRRQPLDRTFEAIECVPCTIENDLKSLIVLIPTHFARSHGELLMSLLDLPDSTSC